MAKLVTAKELSDYLKLSDSTIYKLALNGEIPGFKIGDSWRFDMEEVLERLREGRPPVREGSVPTQGEGPTPGKRKGK